MISFAIEWVSPDLARYYLSLNSENNREVDWRKVGWLTELILDGKWRLTNHLIAFDPAGRLVDGQHRLHAICQANQTVELAVMRGLPWDE